MESYTAFSQWYDEFMDEVPYDEWCDFIVKVLKENGINEGIVCELGSGTGNMTEKMAVRGYDMIGIDSSAEMLSVAQTKRMDSDNEAIKKILYLCQDMRNFELYGTVAAVFSSFDSINYILDEEELVDTFKLINNYLDPKGVFVFDFNTRVNYERIAESDGGFDEIGGVTYIWSNCYDEESHVNEHELIMFVPESDESDLYEKCCEYHYQRGYSLEEIKALIKKAGLEFVKAYDGYDFSEAKEDSMRIFVVARESGK